MGRTRWISVALDGSRPAKIASYWWRPPERINLDHMQMLADSRAGPLQPSLGTSIPYTRQRKMAATGSFEGLPMHQGADCPRGLGPLQLLAAGYSMVRSHVTLISC